MSRAQWLVVARREFLERVRTKWFVAVTLLGPLAMIAILVIPAALASKGAEDAAVVVVLDDSPYKVAESLSSAVLLTLTNVTIEVPDERPSEDELRRRIRDQEIDGYLLVPADVDEGGRVVYRGDNATNLSFVRIFYAEVSGAIQRARADRTWLPKETVSLIFKDIAFDNQHDTGTGKTSSGAASFIIGYVAMFVVYMAILLYAVNVLRSVVQEKTSRVVEMVVSATRPRSLMLGKIFGVGSVGLVQLGTWAIIALVLARYYREILGVFGVATAGIPMPEVAAADLGVILAFFLVGYFFYAAIYAAIGAMVSSDQEGQQAQTPVVVLLIIPVLCVQLVANDPRSFASEVLTMIPLSAPVLMPMRYILGGTSPAGIALSLAILAASTAVVTLVAARIYRVGILMVGKKPTMRELWRWIRY